MPYKSDSTHAKNIANFSALIEMLRTFGPVYQPVNPDIALPRLEAQLQLIEQAQSSFIQARPRYSDAVDKQQLEFEPLSSLTTSVANAFKAAGVTAKARETLNTITRKIKGERAGKAKGAAATGQAGGSGEGEANSQDTISAAQMGYANRIDNFALLVETLRNEPRYTPLEPHLAVEGLQQKLEALRQRYHEVSIGLAPLQELRQQRNLLLYAPGTGLIDTVRTIKAYIKSIYKTDAAQYKHVTALRFSHKG